MTDTQRVPHNVAERLKQALESQDVDTAPKLTVRATKGNDDFPVLVLCDEHGCMLPHQTDVTITNSGRTEPGGGVVRSVTVTFFIDGRDIALQPHLKANESTP